jgi:hypothetical protein
MRWMTCLLTIMVAAASCSAAAVEAPAPKAGAKPGAVVQPTKIPGEWKLVEPQFPPIASILKRKPSALPVYGLYGWCGEYRGYRNDIKKVGWKAIRIGGPMDDKAMTMFCQDGVEIMKTLGVRVHGENRNRSAYDSDEAFLKDNMAGITAFMERYGPGGTFFKENPDVAKRPITDIEVWNEPNFQYMIPPRKGVDRPVIEREREALYAKVLPLAYKTIKARWPRTNVVGFGAGGASRGDIRFIKNVHAKSPAVAKSYDTLSTHPYQPPIAPEAFYIKPWGGFDTASSLKEIRDILAGHGRRDAPIWYTEVGWPISQKDGGMFKDKPGQVYVSPLLQAAYVVRQYALSMRLGVDRVHIMFASDSDGFNGGFFTRGDKLWRPSAYAVQTMISLMPLPRLTGTVSDGKGGYFAYTFEPDTRPIGDRRAMVFTMAWNVAGPKNVTLPCKTAAAMVFDMFGHRKIVKSAGGKVSVDIGPCPIYVMVFTDD